MKSLLNFRGVSGIAFSVFLAILILLSIYFFVRINKYEKEIQQHGFNVLNQLSKAVHEKDKTLESVGDNLNGSSDINNKFLTSKGLRFSRTEITDDSICYKLKDASIYMNISYADFLKPLLRDDFLTEYMLIEKRSNSSKNDKLVFSTFPYNIDLRESNIFNAIIKASANESVFNSKSTLDSISASSVFQAGIIRKVNIQGKDYEIFLIPITINNRSFYIAGFIEEKIYIEMKRGLDSTTVFIFILVLGVILFSLPLLKIFLMGPLEKLNRFNITLAGISLVGGVIVIVVLTTITYIFYRSKDNIHHNLIALNTQIIKDFTKESKDLIDQMIEYDKSVHKLEPGKSINSVLLNDEYAPQIISYFKTFFWIDSSNMQIMQISTRSNAGALTDLSKREYVKNYSNWLWENFSEERKSLWYNMEPIFSNTSGEWLLAFSTPSNKKYTSVNNNNHLPTENTVKLMGITSNMYSLHDPILPDGYEYCLVDNKGKVWFYSNNRLYVNEDIVKACNKNQRLAAALHSGADDIITVKLHGKTYYAYIKPILNTQLYMITLCNPSGVKLFAAQASFFSFVSLMLIFGLLLIFYLFLLAFRYKKSNLAGKTFFFSWMLPNGDNYKKYFSLFAGNIFVLLGLMFFSISNIYRILSPVSVVVLMASLIILNFFVSFFYLQRKRSNVNLNWREKGYFIALISILLFIDAIAWFSYEPGLVLKSVVLQLLILSSFQFFFLFKDRIITLIYKISSFRFLNWIPFAISGLKKQAFILFLSSWLALSAAIPSFLIVKKTLNFEFRNYITNQQISIAQQFNNRTDKVYKFFNVAIPVKNNSKTVEERLKKGNYFNFLHDTHFDTINSEFKPDNSMYSRFSQISRYYYNFLLGEKDFLEINQQIIIGVNNENPSLQALQFNTYNYDKSMLKQAAKREISSNIDFSYFNPLKTNGFSLFFWTATILLLILLLVILKLLIQKHFNFDSFTNKPVLLDECLKQLEESRLSGVIVNINHADLSLDYLKNHKYINLSAIEFKIPEIEQVERLIVLGLQGFEDINTFVTKIENLEKLMDKYPNQLAIMLYTSPNLLLELYTNQFEGKAENGKTNLPQNQIQLLQKVFANIPVLYSKRTTKLNKTFLANNIESMVQCELSLDSYTKKLEPIVYNYLEQIKKKTAYTANIKNKKESLILKIQELALPHYNFLWNNLSFREKFVLYDLTQDTIVNLQNKEILNSLLGKGILECDNAIKFTSMSFKNFILTMADKTELEEKQKDIIASGDWNRLRSPLIIIAASIIIFLFATQINFLSNLYGILISVGTLLGVFMRFSGMFKKPS